MKYPFLYVLAAGSLMFGCKSAYKTALSEYQSAAYQKAIPLFQKYAQSNSAQGAEANFFIAQSYRLSNRPSEAIPYYETALKSAKLKPAQKDSVQFFYAQTLKTAEKYEEASKIFAQYAQSGLNEKFKKHASKEVESITRLKEIEKEETLTSLYGCEAINSEAADFAPTFSNNALIFTSTRRKEKTYSGTGEGFADLYAFVFSDMEKGQGTVAPMGSPFNLDGIHDASATYSPDGKNMIFVRSGKGEKKEIEKEVSLYSSSFQNNQWSNPERLAEISFPQTWDGTPFISPDGKELYFSSNREGSKGGLDIFKCKKNPNGSWSYPENMGALVNTEGNEMFPYIDKKGRFFFASDGHTSFGGLDIFVIENNKVRNVGKPINSSADDFGLLYVNDSLGYFTSNRKGALAKGDDDIYRFVNDSLNTKEAKYYLQGIAYWSDYETQKREILPNTELELISANQQTVFKTISDAQGKFLFDTALVMGNTYTFTAQKSGYLGKKEIYPTKGKEVPKTSLKQRFTKIYLDTMVVLTKDILVSEGKNPPEIEILYKYDKWDITEASAAKLDQFVLFLNEYLAYFPDVVIEMGSHTDERGSNQYNQKLAQKRAESAVNYIVTKGVDSKRIIARGYGEEEPKIRKAKTEEQHQENRRTTIKVFKKSEYKGR